MDIFFISPISVVWAHCGPWHHRPMHAVTAWAQLFWFHLGYTFTSSYFAVIGIFTFKVLPMIKSFGHSTTLSTVVFTDRQICGLKRLWRKFFLDEFFQICHILQSEQVILIKTDSELLFEFLELKNWFGSKWKPSLSGMSCNFYHAMAPLWQSADVIWDIVNIYCFYLFLCLKAVK